MKLLVDKNVTTIYVLYFCVYCLLLVPSCCFLISRGIPLKVGMDYYVVIFTSTILLCFSALTCITIYDGIKYVRVIDIQPDRITSKLFWQKPLVIYSNDIVDIGKGFMDPKMTRKQYIYFSKRILSEEDKTKIINLPKKYKGEVVFVRYSPQVYQYVKTAFPERF